MEVLLAKVSQWIPNNSSWDPFFSAIVLQLIKQYPYRWNFQVKQVGHPRTGFIEDKTWTLTAGKHKIVIECPGDRYTGYPDVYFNINGDDGPRFSLLSNGTIARGLELINMYVKDITNQESWEVIYVSENKYQRFTDNEILASIVDNLELVPEFLSELVTRLIMYFQIQWEVETEKIGHPRTGYIEHHTYSFTLDPYTIIIKDTKISFMKKAAMLYSFDYKEFPSFLTDQLQDLLNLQVYVPKYKLFNQDNNVYVIYQQGGQYANREGFLPRWSYVDSFVDKHKAYKRALVSNRFIRTIIVSTPLSNIINKSPINTVVKGDIILFFETCLTSGYYKIEYDSNGKVVRTIQNWDEHYADVRRYE